MSKDKPKFVDDLQVFDNDKSPDLLFTASFDDGDISFLMRRPGYRRLRDALNEVLGDQGSG